MTRRRFACAVCVSPVSGAIRGWVRRPVDDWSSLCPTCWGHGSLGLYAIARRISGKTGWHPELDRLSRNMRRILEGRRVRSRTALEILNGLVTSGLLDGRERPKPTKKRGRR